MTQAARRPGAALRPFAASALAWALAATLGVLAGCASPAGAPLGAARPDVLASLGAPALRSPLPGGGERLLYTTQPSGFHVYHLDFDAAGRLVHRTQVLTQERLLAIPVGQWTVADVQRTFGPPMRIEQVARFDGDIWTYRLLGDFSTRRQGHVHIDRAGVVRVVMFTDEPTPGDDLLIR